MTAASIPDLLEHAAARHPERVALVGRSGRHSYAELQALAEAAAGALWYLGVRPGLRVAACLPNDIDIVIAFHGAQRIGAIWTGIGEALTDVEQQHLVDVCDPVVVLSGPQGKLSGKTVVDLPEWHALLSVGHSAPLVSTDSFAPAGIAFSSGTTGRPKAVVHSQRNLLLPADVLLRTRGWDHQLRKGDSLPFTILNMLVLSTLVTTTAGGCCIVMDRRDAGGIAEWVGTEQINVWNGAPAQLFDLARRPELDLSNLTEIWSGGGDLPDHVRSAFADTHPQSLTATYGLSEAPTVVAIDPAGGAHRSGASGQVLPHLDVAGYDDDGRRLPAGQTGQLGISAAEKGPWAKQWSPPLGYWEHGRVRPHGPAPLMTGDVGAVDADGWLTMVDRKKLLIVRGGANVAPAEVERVLLEYPQIQSAVVFGIPDPRLGQRVAALIVPSEEPLDADALTEFCSARLARYKVPERWGQVRRLPTNAMGKIIRTELLTALARSNPM